MDNEIHLRSLSALVYRCPVEEALVTSFGTMRDRPMVLVRAEDSDGAVGWGEIWCNFPGVGAEHRARLVQSVLAPLATSRSFRGAIEAYHWLTARTAVLAIQSGEPGPLAQAIAGIDIALWDLIARRVQEPMWRLLGGRSAEVPVYASGLNPVHPEIIAAARKCEGYTAFKVKIGFGEEQDVANLATLRAALGRDVNLMADANQGWTLEQAIGLAPRLEQFHLAWLEEPLRADRPWSDWTALRACTEIPLAAGENLVGEAAFKGAIESGAIDVMQPDIAKWGGFTGCLPIARKTVAEGLRYCPHYLGGGVGLLASGHLLAAVGGSGLLEVDANPNPLRELLCGPVRDVHNGVVTLGTAAGLGPEPDIKVLAKYAVSV